MNRHNIARESQFMHTHNKFCYAKGHEKKVSGNFKNLTFGQKSDFWDKKCLLNIPRLMEEKVKTEVHKHFLKHNKPTNNMFKNFIRNKIKEQSEFEGSGIVKIHDTRYLFGKNIVCFLLFLIPTFPILLVAWLPLLKIMEKLIHNILL